MSEIEPTVEHRPHRETDRTSAWLPFFQPIVTVIGIVAAGAVAYARLGDVQAASVATSARLDEHVRAAAPDAERVRVIEAQQARVEKSLVDLETLARKMDRDLTIVTTKMQDAKLIK